MFPCMRARLVRLCVEVCDIGVCQCSYKSSAAPCMTVPISVRVVPLAETKAIVLNNHVQTSCDSCGKSKKVYLPNKNTEWKLRKGSLLSCSLSLSHASTGLEISASSLICWHTQAHTQSNWEVRWRRAEMSSASGDGDVGVINFVGSLGPWASQPLPFIFYQVQESPLFSLLLVALLQGSPALSVARSYRRLVPATWLQED